LPASKLLGTISPKLIDALVAEYNDHIAPRLEHFTYAGQTTEGLRYADTHNLQQFSERVFRIDDDQPYDPTNNYSVFPLTKINNTFAHSIPSDTPPIVENLSYKLMRAVHLDPSSSRYTPSSDPKNFTTIIESLPPTFEVLLKALSTQGQIARTYIATLGPNTSIFEHIDADSCEYIKVHIPLVSSPECKIAVRYKKQLQVFDNTPGSIMFYNVGYPHYATNNSTSTKRVNLVVTFNTQQILEFGESTDLLQYGL
jgi:hypothetical protein